MSTEIHTLTLAQMQHALQQGEASSRELTDHCLARIDALNPGLNACGINRIHLLNQLKHG